MTTYTIDEHDYTTDDVVADIDSEREIEGISIKTYNMGLKNPDYDQQSPASKYFVEKYSLNGHTQKGLQDQKSGFQKQITDLQNRVTLCDLYLAKVAEVEAE